MRDEAPRSVQEHISVRPMGVETLLYDRRRHRAFCLNATSSAVWRLADGVRTIAEIARAASLELGAEIDEELVCYAIEELRQDGLMELALLSAQERADYAARAATAAGRGRRDVVTRGCVHRRTDGSTGLLRLRGLLRTSAPEPCGQSAQTAE